MQYLFKLWPCRLLVKLHCMPKTKLESLPTMTAQVQSQLVLLTVLGLNDHHCMYPRFPPLSEALNGLWSRCSSLTLTSCDSLMCLHQF